MQIKNNELPTVYNYLSACTVAGLSVPELKKLRAARRKVKELMDEYLEIRKSIWDSYGVKNDEELREKENKDEIIAKVEEHDETEVAYGELGLNFLPEEKVIGCCPETFNQVDVDKMLELLQKNTPN